MKLSHEQYEIYKQMISIDDRMGYMSAVNWLINQVKKKQKDPNDCQEALKHYLMVVN